ncbi:MAG: hypothetical protein Q8Q67_04145 [bacterium]|nr:hypothetical protein [bacterium]
MAATPKFSIELNATVTPAGVITLRLRAGKDGIPQALEFLIFRNGVQIVSSTTGTDGFYNYTETNAPTASPQIFTFEAYLKDSVVKATSRIDIPAITAANTATANDPEKCILIRRHDGFGNFRSFIRVLKSRGYGVETDVDIIYQNNRHTVRTDARGIATWDVPGVINPGDDETVVAIVNGIEDHAKLRIRRRILVPRPPRFSRAYFGTNNGRAFILLSLAALFMIWAFIIGIGQPLIHETMFRDKETGLSKQEQLHNRILADAYGQSIAEPPNSDIEIALIKGSESPGHWHHWIWKIAFALFFISISYGIFSQREEIAEEVSIAIERIIDRDYVQSGDPWFERMVAFTGAYSVARNPAIISADGSAAPTKKRSIWSEFPVHLASDAITEILPAIFRAIF